jgi:hypothetical protein
MTRRVFLAGGAYNVAEPGPQLSVEKVSRELGWDASFRLPVPG